MRFVGMSQNPFSLNNHEEINFKLFNISERKKALNDNSVGVVKIIMGTVLVPLGGFVSIANSFEKCEENDGIFTGGFGPCSKSGPSKPGQFLGFGVSITGLYLIISGIVQLSK